MAYDLNCKKGVAAERLRHTGVQYKASPSYSDLCNICGKKPSFRSAKSWSTGVPRGTGGCPRRHGPPRAPTCNCIAKTAPAQVERLNPEASRLRPATTNAVKPLCLKDHGTKQIVICFYKYLGR